MSLQLPLGVALGAAAGVGATLAYIYVSDSFSSTSSSTSSASSAVSTSGQQDHEAIVPQFITGDFQPQRVFLPDREYGLALDALVKACSDVLIVSADGERLFLGKRKVEPQPDWWFIGGRARPGDTTRVAASRNVKRELQLDLPVDRFQAIATYSMVWQWRQQAPATNGTADISTVHVLQLTEAEEVKVVLDPKEYESSAYVPFGAVLEGEYHPCLKQAVRDLLKHRALGALCRAVSAAKRQGGSADSVPAVATAAQRFVAAHEASIQPKESTKVHFRNGAYLYA